MLLYTDLPMKFSLIDPLIRLFLTLPLLETLVEFCRRVTGVHLMRYTLAISLTVRVKVIRIQRRSPKPELRRLQDLADADLPCLSLPQAAK